LPTATSDQISDPTGTKDQSSPRILIMDVGVEEINPEQETANVTDG